MSLNENQVCSGEGEIHCSLSDDFSGSAKNRQRYDGLWFDTNGANFEFRAGQHADFVSTHSCMGSEGDNSRTFSLASSPHDKEPIMIAMRMRKTPLRPR